MTGMPSVLPVAAGLTPSLNSLPSVHLPGGAASPCAPAGSDVTHAIPGLQPPVGPVVPDVQNARSPCLAASIATVTMPAAAKLSATLSTVSYTHLRAHETPEH